MACLRRLCPFYGSHNTTPYPQVWDVCKLGNLPEAAPYRLRLVRLEYSAAILFFVFFVFLKKENGAFRSLESRWKSRGTTTQMRLCPPEWTERDEHAQLSVCLSVCVQFTLIFKGKAMI